MKKYDDVPSKEGYLQYDKNAKHIKSFNGLYRPLVVFTNKNCGGQEFIDFLVERWRDLIDWPDDISFENKSTLEIRQILSHKIYVEVIIEDHSKKVLDDIIHVLNYYAYSCLLLHSRTDISEINNYVWDQLNLFGANRAVLCVEDLMKGSVDWTILYKTLKHLLIKLKEEQFTFAKKYGIINCKRNIIKNENSKVFSNIHIN